ncbi:hypothetical protein EXIGLDRAFT_726747 [Exidia glandulosa HHB12029]|uniref:Sulfate transporter family protein n=1 Tax=Exidia glandulosa HHB12029 TaxID=1314781 RepID=A0A165M6Z3_EXIGL|nr:hypothetical protein EXIGLDRAFT_726747 [Exidia glandulosa HHB12029]
MSTSPSASTDDRDRRSERPSIARTSSSESADVENAQRDDEDPRSAPYALPPRSKSKPRPIQRQRSAHSPDVSGSNAVRESTLHLASLPFSPGFRASPASLSSQQPQPSANGMYTFPGPSASAPSAPHIGIPMPATAFAGRFKTATPATGTSIPTSTSNAFSRGTPRVDAPRVSTPSALSVLLAQHASQPASGIATYDTPSASTSNPTRLIPSPGSLPSTNSQQFTLSLRSVEEQDDFDLPTPRATNHQQEVNPFDDILSASDTPRPRSPEMVSERTPLLPAHAPFDKDPNKSTVALFVVPALRTAAAAVPAVFLGLLLNVLDGVSYGLIMFPPAAVFEGFGAIGVSMFFATTIISQLIYTFGASGFAGANGSMIIEVVPFFHLIATAIIQELGPDADPRDIIATTMAAFALSSILTGLAFLALGFFKLGNLISFFPRHILIGCIGGVGWFLIETGLEVCGGLKEESFQYNWDQFSYFFLNAHVLSLWLPAFLLAVALRCITHRWDHQLIFPLYFISICVVFYLVVAIGRFDLAMLRNEGWVFDIGDAGNGASWWTFYTYFDFRRTNLYCLWITLPTQMALLFFNLLHPPLNIPALAISLDHDVDTNKELVAHGYSNLAAGFLGTVPNYIVYVNSLLFYRVGGDSRIAGFLLAVATFGLLIIGTGPIAYIPVMLVGALIFVLGLDLVKEAVWDTRNRVSRLEYLTIWSIIIVMSVFDFVVGVLAGIIFCCFFFVIQTSQARSIRTLHTGASAMSTVRRPPAHREYIKKVAKQTATMRLQGWIFFGTINNVENSVKRLLDAAQWQNNPIRFLIIDLSLVLGVDISSCEALVRLQRLLDSKSVMLIFCGMSEGSSVWRSLHNVDIFGERNVEVFDTTEQAIEWTENAYIRAWFLSQGSTHIPIMDKPILQSEDRTPITWGESYVGSPRRTELRLAGQDLISRTVSATPADPTAEPFPTLLKVFWSLTPSSASSSSSIIQRVIPYLLRTPVQAETVLWHQGDAPDGLYFVEAGLLRAVYDFGPHTAAVQECMVAGTISGELSALSGMSRNATVVAERDSILWRWSREDMERMHRDDPQLAKMFTELILKVAKVEYDVLLSSLAGRT